MGLTGFDGYQEGCGCVPDMISNPTKLGSPIVANTDNYALDLPKAA